MRPFQKALVTRLLLFTDFVGLVECIKYSINKAPMVSLGSELPQYAGKRRSLFG